MLYGQIITATKGTAEGLEARQGLTRVYVRWSKETEAQASLTTLMAEYSQHKDLAAAVTKVADCYRTSGKPDRALTIYRSVISKWPATSSALWSQTNLVICHRRLKDTASAEAALSELYRRFAAHPKLSKAVNTLATSYRKAGQL